MRGTLLMAAVATQQMELIELLLSAGASVHVTDAFGCTVISAASCPLDHQPIRCKLAQGVKPTASRTSPRNARTSSSSAVVRAWPSPA